MLFPCRAAAAAGLDLVQHTKQFSLSDVAARYAETAELSSLAAAAATDADAADVATATYAAAAASATNTRASPENGASMLDITTAQTVSADGSSGIGSTSHASRLAAGSGSSSSDLGSLDPPAATAGAAAAAAGDKSDAEASPLQQLDSKLQRHWFNYFINLYLVSGCS
jgi:hypothetical protein